jgi:hypothetical protein
MRLKTVFIKYILLAIFLIATIGFSIQLYAFEDIGTLSREEEISGENLTILGFTIGESTLWDIFSKLGDVGVRIILGDADHFDSVCYKSKKDKVIVVFRYSDIDNILRSFALMSTPTDVESKARCGEV